MSSASPVSSASDVVGATGTASTSLAGPRLRAALSAARVVAPVPLDRDASPRPAQVALERLALDRAQIAHHNATLASTTPIGGVPHHLLKLTPKDAASLFKTVTLWVRASDALVTRLEVDDQNGASHRFDLSNIERNPALPAGTFSFAAPAGAEVTDLRM